MAYLPASEVHSPEHAAEVETYLTSSPPYRASLGRLTGAHARPSAAPQAGVMELPGPAPRVTRPQQRTCSEETPKNFAHPRPKRRGFPLFVKPYVGAFRNPRPREVPPRDPRNRRHHSRRAGASQGFGARGRSPCGSANTTAWQAPYTQRPSWRPWASPWSRITARLTQNAAMS
jgi:hypothetical protein